MTFPVVVIRSIGAEDDFVQGETFGHRVENALVEMFAFALHFA
jgi:hypothetical protein